MIQGSVVTRPVASNILLVRPGSGCGFTIVINQYFAKILVGDDKSIMNVLAIQNQYAS